MIDDDHNRKVSYVTPITKNLPYFSDKIVEENLSSGSVPNNKILVFSKLACDIARNPT